MRYILLFLLLSLFSCRQHKSLDEQYPGLSERERQALQAISAKKNAADDLEISKADTVQYVTDINSRIDPQKSMVICRTVTGMDFQNKELLDRTCSSMYVAFLKSLDGLKYDLIDVRVAQKNDSGREIYGRVYIKVPTPPSSPFHADDPPFVYGFWATMRIMEAGGSLNADCSSPVYTASPIYVDGRSDMLLYDDPKAFEPSSMEGKTDYLGSRWFVH